MIREIINDDQMGGKEKGLQISRVNYLIKGNPMSCECGWISITYQLGGMQQRLVQSPQGVMAEESEVIGVEKTRVYI